MANRNDLRWQNNYEALKAYIEEHHYLPDKRKVENRKLVNWWKYNRRRIRLGKIDPERARKLEELSNMRWLWGSRGLFVSRSTRGSILWTRLDRFEVARLRHFFLRFSVRFLRGGGIAGGNVSLECDTPAKMAARAALHERQKPCFVKFVRHVCFARYVRHARHFRYVRFIQSVHFVRLLFKNRTLSFKK